MSPYSLTLRLVRLAHEKSQQETAQGIGVGRSYFNRVETSTKPPLSKEKTELLIAFLDLTSAEVAALERARALSELRFMVPATLMPGQIELANRFHRALNRLSPEQVAILNTQLVAEEPGSRRRNAP